MATESLSFSKEKRWYYHDIRGHIKTNSRKLLEEYSHIPAKDIDSHIYKFRDELWSQAPYPCVGEFKFLTLHLPSHPKYQHVLSLLSHPTSPNPPIQLLDLGCCVGQELRSLTYAGVNSSQLYGSDMIPKFLSTSYALFNDKDSFRATLVLADVFDGSIFSNAWTGWEGKFGVVHAGLFLHLFDRNRQIAVCETIVKLMSREKGTMFLGEMVGCEGGGERGAGSTKGETRMQFLHDGRSFAKMWGEVAERTGTVGMWKVEGAYKKRVSQSGNASFFTGEGIGWLTFSVERI